MVEYRVLLWPNFTLNLTLNVVAPQIRPQVFFILRKPVENVNLLQTRLSMKSRLSLYLVLTLTQK